MNLAEAFNDKKDNFLLLRFVAACMVIFGHSYAIANLPDAQHDFIARYVGGTYTGTMAVEMFFVISGFLVTSSYIIRDNFFVFVKSRCLRIYPGLLACVLLTTILLGIFFSTLSWSDYGSQGQVYRYLLGNGSLLMLQWDLPGVFAANPHATIVNGSLWTLPGEMRMYVWVAVLGVLGVYRRLWLFNLVLLAVIALHFEPHAHRLLLGNPDFDRMALLFAWGGWAYLHRKFFPLHGGILLVLILLSIWTWPGSVPTRLSTGTFSLAIAYFCFWFAYVRPIPFPKILGDCSYGMYLWGFPIQQVVATILIRYEVTPTPMLIFMLALPLAILAGVLSWRYIEKPALSLKLHSIN
jgi:peptidoglycan/LPS O-acetylase OafA/YrhL